MSILIRGMEMPVSCAECDAEGYYENSYGDEYGFFCPFGYKAYTSETRDAKRLDNCPLVELPPHGRCIDADLLCKVLQKNSEDEWNNKTAPFSWAYAYDCVKDTVENMPTIIPAEEDEA